MNTVRVLSVPFPCKIRARNTVRPCPLLFRPSSPRIEGRQVVSWLGIIYKKGESVQGGDSGDGFFIKRTLTDEEMSLKEKSITTVTTAIFRLIHSIVHNTA